MQKVPWSRAEPGHVIHHSALRSRYAAAAFGLQALGVVGALEPLGTNFTAIHITRTPAPSIVDNFAIVFIYPTRTRLNRHAPVSASGGVRPPQPRLLQKVC